MTSTITFRTFLASVLAPMGGLAIGLSLSACDLGMKDLGDESESAGDDGGSSGSATPGGTCEPGEQAPADDGCNTCTCDDSGHWSCTAIGCDPTQGATSSVDDGGDGVPPGPCEPGEEMPAGDGCNTCVCDDTGQWACTAIGCDPTGGPGCTPGDQMPADDGCNTCTCGDDGTWGCTEIACVPQVNVCQAQDPGYATIVAASVVGDDLLVSLSYGGGCEDQFFSPCWDGAFAESDPVQTWLALSHSGAPDPCDAVVQDDLSFSLLPMRAAYEEGYQTTSGEIIIHLDGWEGSLTYAW